VLHAQLPSVHFFQALGYVRDGGEFLESGVPHVLMRKVMVAQRAAG